MAKDIHAQSVPLPKFPMSAFDLGYDLKTCSSIGRMNCHYVEEAIPGDIAHIRTDLFVRMDPLTFPVMHRIKVRQNFFFVPTRLVLGDDLNEEFFSCKDMAAKLPTYTLTGAATALLGKNSLFDQMECQPIVTSPSNPVVVRNPLPFLMYHLIFRDFYADEILQATRMSDIDNLVAAYRAAGLNGTVTYTGPGSNPFYTHNVAYSKDRFTSAQPDAQRVGEVYLMNPLSVTGVSSGSEYVLGTYNGSPDTRLHDRSGSQVNASANENLRASLTIDELWDEMVVQRFLNSMNEFGNERYIEILAGQFGVLSADARLQRPQWIGGNEMVVNVSEVLQTSESTSGNPLGTFAGKGIVAGRGRDIAFKVPEHGFILGILTFVPENGYASGSPRWVYKQNPLDFAFPRFNNLGEQAVLNGELFSDHYDDANTGDFGEFGYQPQFDEYRSHPSRATGDFRESTFLPWHLNRKFTSVPPLNEAFIQISAQDNNRIFNDTDPTAQHLRIDAWHKALYVRPISRHPVPGKL